MADKKDAGKKPDEGKDATKGGKEEAENSAEKSASKLSKMTIITGVAGILVIGLSVGGFFAYKTFSAKSTPQAALQADAHGDAAKAKPAEHGDAKEASSAKKDANAHGEASKGDAHGEANKGDAAHGGGASTKEEHKKAEKPQKAVGSIFDIPKMELNVGGPDSSRGYVRVALAIEYLGEEEAKKELEARTPQYRDIIITRVANSTKSDLLTAKGREDLRKSIFNAINSVNEQPIKSLYFTEFLVE